jgi:hypothetical protein
MQQMETQQVRGVWGAQMLMGRILVRRQEVGSADAARCGRGELDAARWRREETQRGVWSVGDAMRSNGRRRSISEGWSVGLVMQQVVMQDAEGRERGERQTRGLLR